MRLLHLVKTSTGGTWAFRLMRDLVQMGEEVHVAMPTNGTLVQQYKNAGIIIHELDYSANNIFATMKKIRTVVEKINPDIVHSHFVLTTMLMRMALRNIKVARVFQVPGPLHLEHIFFRKADIWTAQKKIDFWIPTCTWVLNRYKACGITSNRLFLTYYGNDLLERTYTKGLLRSELGLSNSDIVVGMVAFMYAPKKYLGESRGLKGHEDLIDAVSMIQDKYPNLHFVCVGGPWVGAEKYEKKVIEYGVKKVRNIHFLGTRNNIPELYQDLDLVVHPSHTENLGGAGESLMLEIPTVATNVGGFPDIVIPNKTGYLVEPRNPISIANAIEHIIANPQEAKEMAKNGKQYVYKMLNAKNTSKDVYEIYRHIIEQFSHNIAH